MKPYGYKRKSNAPHGKHCSICNPPLRKRQGRRNAREEEKKMIEHEYNSLRGYHTYKCNECGGIERSYEDSPCEHSCIKTLLMRIEELERFNYNNE